jgi:hypothetical protein
MGKRGGDRAADAAAAAGDESMPACERHGRDGSFGWRANRNRAEIILSFKFFDHKLVGKIF